MNTKNGRVTLKRSKRATATKAPTKAQAREEHSRYAVSGDTTAALVVAEFSKSLFGDVLEGVVEQMEDRVEAVHLGDRRDAEALLMAQAVGLNSMYTELTVFGRMNLVKNLDVAERLIRLGLKAQSQSQATIETLATTKNPLDGIRTTGERRARSAAGEQAGGPASPTRAALARAEDFDSAPNKLLEHHSERLDVGTANAAIARDQALATVGIRNRPADD